MTGYGPARSPNKGKRVHFRGEGRGLFYRLSNRKKKRKNDFVVGENGVGGNLYKV